MLAVCISHFGEDLVGVRRSLGFECINAGHIATPLFLLLSGAVIGHLMTITRESLAKFSSRLIDRGIFVLVVGHPLIAACFAESLVASHTWSASLFRSIYITDVIGLGMCISGLLWFRLQPTKRSLITAATGLYALSWTIAMLAEQLPVALRLPMAILFGATDTTGMGIEYAVPIVPYLSIMFAGQALGQWASANLADALGQRRLGEKFLQWGVCATTLAWVIKTIWSLRKPDTSDALLHMLTMTLSPLQKLPPGPNYLLFYGGAGLALLGLLLIAVSRNLAPRLIDSLAVVGRASFGIFVLQFFMYSIVIASIPASTLSREWLLWLALSVIALWCAAVAWDQVNGNRWFTVGLRPTLQARLSSVDY